MNYPLRFDLCRPNTSSQSYTCGSYDFFKPATDLHACSQIVHAGELADEVAAKTNLAFALFLIL